MILGDVEETVTTVEIDEETYEELYKVKRVSAADVAVVSFLSWFVLFFCILVHKEEHPHAVCARGRRRPRGSAPPRGLAARLSCRQGPGSSSIKHRLWASRCESCLLFCVKVIPDTVGADLAPA